jgi:hypothetical protein
LVQLSIIFIFATSAAAKFLIRRGKIFAEISQDHTKTQGVEELNEIVCLESFGGTSR